MVLGDATLVQRNPGTAFLQFAHKADDREYVEMKCRLLNWNTSVKTNDGVSKLKGKEYPYVAGRTMTHPLYGSLYDHFYYQKRKTVDEHVMKCLTPLGLALWYFDDGTLAGEVGYRCPFICSHNFNKTENELLAREVHKKFGVTFRAIKKNIKDKTYYWLRLRRKDREKFLDLVSPFAPKCMERKINPEFYDLDKKYNELTIKDTCIRCKKEFMKKQRSTSSFCSDECAYKTRRETRMLNEMASSQ